MAVPVAASRGQSGGDRRRAPCRSSRRAPVRVLHRIQRVKAGPSHGGALGPCTSDCVARSVTAMPVSPPMGPSRRADTAGNGPGGDQARTGAAGALPRQGAEPMVGGPVPTVRPARHPECRSGDPGLETCPARRGKQARTSALRACPAAARRRFPRPGPRPTAAVPWPWRARVSVCPVSVGCACARLCAARAASWP